MGLIIVKKAKVNAEYFAEVVKAASGIIRTANYGLVTIKKNVCLNVNFQELDGYTGDLPGLNYIRDDDEAVVTLVHTFKDEESTVPERSVPAVFDYDINKMTYSSMGDLFITTSHKYHFYFDQRKSHTFDEYLHHVVNDERYLSLLENSEFDKVVNFGPGIATAARCVLGNVSGLHVFGEHNFSNHGGILFSTPFMGDRIMSIIGSEMSSKSSIQSPTKKFSSKNIYYREKRELISRRHEIFFTKDYYMKVPFHDRERYVIISYEEDAYNDNFEIMSLRTGEISEVRFFDLRSRFTGYYFRALHNGTT